MPEPFKEKISAALISKLASQSQQVWPKFKALQFSKTAAQGLKQMELKARVDHVVRRWRDFLPDTYPAALKVVLKTLPPPLQSETGWGDVVFFTWLHAHFVQVFGLQHPQLSLKAMLKITKCGTCEFSIRPFLNQHPRLSRAFLKANLKHPSAHVRRWISEGTRPRLPWAERMQNLVTDPSPNLILLNALRKDPSRYVQTSVANHVGDIAKDHPKIAVALITAWLKEGGDNTPWIAKKALRHLIKQGHPKALKALGFKAGTQAGFSKFKLSKNTAVIGGFLEFEFLLKGLQSENLNIDYGVDFVMAKNKISRKIFKLSSKKIRKGETLRIKKKHSFKIISTRRYYTGKHAIAIVINGREMGKATFFLRALETPF